MIACCSGRALARTGFTLVMTSTECTPRIAKKRWWIRIRRRIKSRYNHVITIIIIMLLIKKMMVIMVMNKLFFGASMWFGFWNNIDEWKRARWSSSVMKFSYVHSQASSWRASLVTVIARKGDSFQMVRLNVVSYVPPLVFLFANFTNIRCSLLGCPICLFPVCNLFVTSFRHWFHFLV